MEAIKREVWVDYAKAIGIYLVVLAHYPMPLSLNGRIFAFHLPLFFFLSGYLFSFDKFDNYNSFLKKRFKQIVIPYIFFSILTYFYWLFIARHFGNDANDNVPFYKPIIGFFYGVNISHYLDHNGPLWFLTCIFVLENIYYLAFKVAIKKNFSMPIILIFIIIGYFDYKYDVIRFPWNLNVALVAIGFYAIGNHAKDSLAIKAFNKVYFNVLLLIILALIFYYTSYYNLNVDFNHNFYGNYFYMYINAFLGIGIVFLACKVLENIFHGSSFIEYLSQNTLTIMALQFTAMGFVKAFYHFILKYPLNAFDNKVAYCLIWSLLGFLSMLPAVYFINRHLPFFLGKPWPNKKKMGPRKINI